MTVTEEDIGTWVEDDAGRAGELMGVIPKWEPPEASGQPTLRCPVDTAFFRPEGGGVEWSAPVDKVRVVRRVSPASASGRATRPEGVVL
ncbi:hypothetical protein [Streptomyces caatingaensis]|uniref:Uncharacterized protein n=1 Tax=Streptomyces caatingaensis TaxID=1678637 RepID=A0A0K9XHK8_9ACTN|nr:hypothetical protein [Streptomyces caatingaensis]KNB52884.1 hypothetical protein AC230_09645 [Streptomyces caatingaensis]